MSAPSSPRTPPAAFLGLLLVALVACWPSLGSLGAGLLSDDAVALGYVHRAEGVLLDWTGPQCGLSSVRFWRPLVTTSLALQEHWTGADPVPLRLFNLLAHALAALLLVGVGRRLGLGWPGALLGGLLAALYPDQGGTVTWIVGRVDSLTAPLFLGALWACLAGRSLLAAPLALLACSSKEIAFVLPLWALACAWGSGLGLRAACSRCLPLIGAVLLAFLLRRLALGV